MKVILFLITMTLPFGLYAQGPRCIMSRVTWREDGRTGWLVKGFRGPEDKGKYLKTKWPAKLDKAYKVCDKFLKESVVKHGH